MKAHVGDRLVPDGDEKRAAVVVSVRNADGSPPYVVRWLSDGHLALVYPGPYTRVVPAPPARARSGRPRRRNEPYELPRLARRASTRLSAARNAGLASAPSR